MINTSEVYSPKYCKKINAKQWRHDLTPNTMKIIYDHFLPKSIVDVGCANGLHLKAFKDLGCKKLFGIEGTKHFIPYINKYYGGDYIIADLRKPLPKLEKFDLVLCLEVLEHLEKEFAHQAVENLLSLGNTLLISACPIKGGFHHLNPQPKEYWINIFESLGAKYYPDDVEKLQEIFKEKRCSGWFKTGLKVFRKVN